MKILVYIVALVLPALAFGQMESEPNGSFGTADLIPFSSLEATVEGRITPDQDEDYYAFQVVQAGVFIITVSNIPTGMNLGMELFADPADAFIARNNGNETFITYMQICSPGTYYIKISDVSVGEDASQEVYTLNVRYTIADTYECNNDFESASDIALGTPVQAQINSDGDLDFYKINVGSSGVFEIFTSNIPTGMNLSIEIYENPALPALIQRNSSSSFNTNILVCTGGDYFIKVSDVSVGIDENEEFYSLVVNFNTEDIYECNNTFEDAFPIPIIGLLQAQINTDGDLDYYQLEIQEPGTITFDMVAIPNGMNLSIELFNSIFQDQTQGNDNQPFEFSFIVCTPGTYYLLVSDISVGVDESDEPYRLVLDYNTDDIYECNNTFPTAAPISCESDVSGSISTTTDTDVFFFSLGSDTDLQVNVFNIPAEIDMDLTLYNNFLEVIDNLDANNGAPLALNVTALPIGDYFIALKDDGSNNSSRDLYRVSFSCPTTSTVEPIQLPPSTLYPNPITNLLNVDLTGFNIGANAKLDILDIHGRKVIEQPMTAPVQTLDLSNIPAGTYFIRVIGKNEQYTGRIVRK